MQLEARKYLFDIERAAELLLRFVAGKTLDAGAVARITDYRKMISFRNILIHGYAEIDDLLVWDIVQSRLPALHREIKAIVSATRD